MFSQRKKVILISSLIDIQTPKSKKLLVFLETILNLLKIFG
jgi:hypothetical protein